MGKLENVVKIMTLLCLFAVLCYFVDTLENCKQDRQRIIEAFRASSQTSVVCEVPWSCYESYVKDYYPHWEERGYLYIGYISIGENFTEVLNNFCDQYRAKETAVHDFKIDMDFVGRSWTDKGGEIKRTRPIFVKYRRTPEVQKK